MNPQYMNQGPGGYGQAAPPPGPGHGGAPGPGMALPGPPQMFNNGPNQQARPPGFTKPGTSSAIPNGPGAGGPPAGDPFAHQRMAGPPLPGSQYSGAPLQQGQLINSMGTMNISGQGPRSGIPPSTMAGPGTMGGPPNMMARPSKPMSGHPMPMGGPPNSMAGLPNSMGVPHTSMPGPPSSMGGVPPRTGQPGAFVPPSSMGFNAPPSMGQRPPMGGQPGPGAPQTSLSQTNGPASGTNGAPMLGQPTAGQDRPPMGGPPTSMAGPPPMMGGPPTSMAGPGMARPPMMGGPPTSMAGPGMARPPMMGGPPTSMVGPGMGGPPVIGGPPTSMAMVGSRMAGPPMMGGPPMSAAGPRMAGPPAMGGPPMSMASSGMADPPIMAVPPTSMMPGMAPGPIPMMGQQQPPVTSPPQAGGLQMGMPPPPVAGGMQMGQQMGAPYQGAPPPMAPGPAYGQRPMAPAGGPMAAPQQPRKLDPDQMPSPIQVIEDDKRSKGGLFPTGQRGSVPPLVTTNFIAEDQGNSSPRFIRSTMYNIPCTGDMLKQTQIPLAINISPFARLHPKEPPPPVVDLGEMGPVRCNRCKAYMCPNMIFADGGRRFQCCFCSCTTDVPQDYFNHLDHTGRRIDYYQRPELSLGTYEFVATKDYCKNGKSPLAPAFIFMLDVSYNSVKSGLVHLLCSQMKEVLQRLPKETGADHSNIRVGFVTYAKQIHFYNVKGSLAQPQMLVVSDIQDVFVPLLDGFLVSLEESETVIDSLMEQIPVMFADSRETEIILGPVIQAGMDALKAAECAGKLFIFHSSLPIAEAPGKLKNRDDRKLLGSDKEKMLLTPQNNFYTKLGQEAVTIGCSVDLFLFNNSYIDVATIGEVSRLTGGQLFKYLYFQADLDAQRFLEDLKNNVERPIAFDAIMRVRTSTGIRAVDFLGNYYMSNTTDVELAAMDCDKSVTVEIKHDDKLSEADGAFLQAAVLYTTISGERRLRIINLAFNCCMQMADLFRNCELDTLINHMAKVAIRSSLNSSPKHVREALMAQCASILACYRKNCASPSSAGQLILPECMKLLPVYTNCIIKSACLQGGADTQTDDRSYLMHLVNSMTVRDTCVFFYPRLLPLHDLDVESTSLPVAIRCSYERLKENGVYILENGLITYVWIGMNVIPEWVQNVFGVQSVAQIDIDKTQLHDLDNSMSRRVRGVFKKIREERHRHMKLVIVRQRDKLEPVFQQYLMEDRGANGSSSYVDFLCHIHKEIRNLLS